MATRRRAARDATFVLILLFATLFLSSADVSMAAENANLAAGEAKLKAAGVMQDAKETAAGVMQDAKETAEAWAGWAKEKLACVLI